jgi:hypothetical protein
MGRQKAKQDRQNKTGRTGQQNRTGRRGQTEQDMQMLIFCIFNYKDVAKFKQF